MTIFEKAQRYIDYCREHDYTLDIYMSDYERYRVHTSTGDIVLGGMELSYYLAQRYDDEVEAGNL